MRLNGYMPVRRAALLGVHTLAQMQIKICFVFFELELHLCLIWYELAFVYLYPAWSAYLGTNVNQNLFCTFVCFAYVSIIFVKISSP